MYLFVLGISAAGLYSAALFRFPLLSIYARPIQNLDKLTGSSPGTGLIMAGCALLLFVAYSLGARLVRRVPARMRFLLIAFPVLFAAILFWTYPVTSIDIYDYLFRGRMLVRFHANTFVMTPINFADDQLFSYVAWRRAVTAYGPIWEWMSWIAASLAGEAPRAAATAGQAGLLPLMLAYKAMATTGFLLCGGALWLALRHGAPEQRWLGLYLWLWNPLALWETVAAGHNDAWMALLIVLALWAYAWTHDDAASTRQIVGWSLVGLLALTIGGLIKYLAFCFGPLLLLATLRRLPTWQTRAGFVALAGLACGGLVVAAYVPFWVGMDTLRNFSDRGTLFTATWLAALQALLVGPLGKEASQHLAASLGLSLFAAGIFWSSIRAWLQPNDMSKHVLGLLLWFLFVCSPWFQPWYLLWALAVVALRPQDTHAVRTVAVFCCTALLSYAAGSFLLPALGWDGRSAAWNALVSCFIYGPPLLMLILNRPKHGAALRLAARTPRMLGARRSKRTAS
jgi:hypothetical protein